MKKTTLFVLALGFLLPAIGYAADPAGFLDGLTSHVNAAMASVAIAAGVLEFGFRLIPSQKPLSWAWIASRSLHSLGRLSESVAAFLDKVLPQNTK